MTTFNFQQAIADKDQQENELAKRLWTASDQDISTHVTKIFQEENSDYATFLISVRDRVVKSGDSVVRTNLLRINNKVKDKDKLTQEEVDLLQSFDLKCWKGMNVQWKTFSTLKNCDFTGATIDHIDVKGDVIWSTFTTFAYIRVSGSIYENTVSGNMSENTVSGNMSGNTVSGDIYANTVAGDIYANTVSGGIYANTVSGGMDCNTVAGDIYANTVSGSMSGNTVSGSMSENKVFGSMCENIVSDNMSENKVSGRIYENTVSGNMSENKVFGSMSKNIVAGNMSENIVSDSMSENIVSGDIYENAVHRDILDNKYKEAYNNQYGWSSDFSWNNEFFSLSD